MTARKVPRISVAGRIAISMSLLSIFAWLVANPIFPDARASEVRHRTSLCESISISCSLLAERNDPSAIETNLRAVVDRNTDVTSACLRQADGHIIAQIGDHERYWRLSPGVPATARNIYVPITSQGSQWGTVEVSFADVGGLIGFLRRHAFASLAVFAFCLNGILFRWYLGRVLTYLDPSKSVPTHVRSTLDTFAEGVVVLDDENRIVLANHSFTEQVGREFSELQGKGVEKLPWRYDIEEEKSPWSSPNEARRGNGRQTGVKLSLPIEETDERTFLVSTSAIVSEKGERRGMIASFDDITLMERKKQELSQMLIELRQSRNELALSNQELQYLATRDPLTGCLNRRSFFETFDQLWKAACRYQQSLSCCMVDIDHFKSVNDNHGHSVGDEVLRQVAETIRTTARDADVVCRYGGEEFCVILPQTDISQAEQAAERLRVAIEELAFENLSVTASIGVSAIDQDAADPQGLLDQADQCLYVAKRCGRNQVIRWDEVPGDIALGDSENSEDLADRDMGSGISIPYAAVTSLLSALAYRDADTAAHSTRVAELCVATARGLMSQQEVYALEIAALLHDIGKIGVPDAILLKPGPLTPEEWETMKLHDRIGVEIVEASFANPELVEIVRYHHATYGGSPDAPQMPRGEEIPLGARIVSIADAYDAMVSDRVYRKGCGKQAAFEELRRCAGKQFDPGLVERFVGVAEQFDATHLAIGSKQTALQIGQQIERLAQAVDAQDKNAIKALATRLESTASHFGIPEIEAVSGGIKDLADDDGELVTLLQMVSELIDLCSSTQKVYTDVPRRDPISTASWGADRAARTDRPLIEMLPDGGVVLTHYRNQKRENRVHLTPSQRALASEFLRQSLSDETSDLERRLQGSGKVPDVLVRISADEDVNLTQLVGANRAVHVVFDTVEGMARWANPHLEHHSVT